MKGHGYCSHPNRASILEIYFLFRKFSSLGLSLPFTFSCAKFLLDNHFLRSFYHQMLVQESLESNFLKSPTYHQILIYFQLHAALFAKQSVYIETRLF